MYDLDIMTEQEVFDAVCNHLLTQNEKSMNEAEDMCMYRGPHGLKCALGIFIPDHEYNRDMELSWGELMATKQVSSSHAQLLLKLQSIHDHDSVSEWKTRLICMANTHKFTIPPILQDAPNV